MDTRFIAVPSTSAYPLFLAYALIVLSLLNSEMGIVGRPFLYSSVGNNAGARSFAPPKAVDYSRLQFYRMPTSMGEQFTLSSSVRIGAEADDAQVRRRAAVALMIGLLELEGRRFMR
jgi:hypothetical protein